MSSRRGPASARFAPDEAPTERVVLRPPDASFDRILAGAGLAARKRWRAAPFRAVVALAGGMVLGHWLGAGGDERPRPVAPDVTAEVAMASPPQPIAAVPAPAASPAPAAATG